MDVSAEKGCQIVKVREYYSILLDDRNTFFRVNIDCVGCSGSCFQGDGRAALRPGYWPHYLLQSELIALP